MRSVVVLPEPDGPSIEKNSPSLTVRSRPSTATTSPYRFSTFSSRTASGIEVDRLGAGQEVVGRFGSGQRRIGRGGVGACGAFSPSYGGELGERRPEGIVEYRPHRLKCLAVLGLLGLGKAEVHGGSLGRWFELDRRQERWPVGEHFRLFGQVIV